jgi:selenide,water dikinase
LALNIAAFPPDLPVEMMSTILRGSAEKVKEAGAVLAGGHTIQDKEPKFGLVVVGLAHPDKIMAKNGAKPGDALVLSKALGTGVVTTALKREEAGIEHVHAAVAAMSTLNRHASEQAVAHGVRGATDITGFGFLGHAMEMAEGAGARFVFEWGQIPFLPGALEYAHKWMFPGGAFNNKSFYGPRVDFDPALNEEQQMLLFDPQTSGGLLLAVPRHQLEKLLAAANQNQPSLWAIGEVVEGEGIKVKA